MNPVRYLLNARRSNADRPPPAWRNAPPAVIQTWPGYQPTPLRNLTRIAADCRINRVWYKDEAARFGIGSFKALGGAYAVWRVLQAAKDPVTVTTATDGNHGRAVAWGAQMFGCRAVIFIPKSCSVERERAIARLGAEVVRTSLGYDDTVRECARVAQTKGYQVVSDTSWPGYTEIPRMVMQGYTVMVQEAIEQMAPERPTHIFVQAGVGGLAAAVCAYMWDAFKSDRPEFVVVEPQGAACLFASAEAGELRAAPEPVHTIMAGLECGEPSPLAWEVLSIGADAFLTIPDDLTAPCMRLLQAGDPPVIAGESAIAGLGGLICAAGDSILRDALKLTETSRALLFGTEGATDPVLFQALIYSKKLS